MRPQLESEFFDRNSASQQLIDCAKDDHIRKREQTAVSTSGICSLAWHQDFGAAKVVYHPRRVEARIRSSFVDVIGLLDHHSSIIQSTALYLIYLIKPI